MTFLPPSLAQPVPDVPLQPVAPPTFGLHEVPNLGMSVTDFIKVIEAPTPGSPAEKAGFRFNDRIYAVNRRFVTNANSFVAAMRDLPPRAAVAFAVRRNGDFAYVRATLDDWAPEAALPPQSRGRLGLPVSNYVVVQKVDPNGVAHKMGLAGGEVLMVLNARSAENAENLVKIGAQIVAGSEINVLFRPAREIEMQAVRISPQGQSTRVPIDTILAAQTGLRAASVLVDEVRRDASAAARMQNQKSEVAGVIDQVLTTDKNVVVYLTNTASVGADSPDTIVISFKSDPLADAVRGLQHGNSLFFRGTLTSATRKEEVDDSLNNALDAPIGTPKNTSKIMAVRLNFDAEALITPQERK